MRRLTAAGFSFAMLSGAAAADGPPPIYGAPPGVYTFSPPVIRLYSWTGVYVGAHAGAGWNDTLVSDEHASFIGGAQIGINFRARNAIFGLEGQWTGSGDSGGDDNGGTLVVFPGGVTGGFETEIDWLATLTGRLGIVWDRSLFYLKGGAAWVHNRYDGFASLAPAASLSGEETRSGWAVGIGYEYAFRSAWSVRLEYLFLDFGGDSITLAGPAGRVAVSDVDQQIHAVTLGINFRFDWPVGGPLGTPE
jgi:outer membrane immunogenic protein